MYREYRAAGRPDVLKLGAGTYGWWVTSSGTTKLVKDLRERGKNTTL